MANSIDDFLNKSSQEQKDKFQALLANVTKDTKDTIKVQEAGQETPTTGLKETKAISDPQKEAEAAQKTVEKNPPAQGVQQTPPQAQQEQNAIDRALDRQAKAATAEQGKTLAGQGVTAEPQKQKGQDIDR
ncbi:MAG: hypothetical protein JNL70_06870 [Saprospiraceae bacterium]|nr:hypothetical protein [Saprospiraceae bacterium]